MTGVLIRREGRAGRITLNRPEALNALRHDMCLSIETALRTWACAPDIALVIIDGAGDKAFCAGGDIVSIYQAGILGEDDGAQAFWRDEYRLNALIADYPKPYLALMDGVVMGGGVGLSAHGSQRVVTERTLFAMPECGIGLIPDAGGSHLLARMPGRTGEYAGLTGARLAAADCLWAGLADHYVPSGMLPALIAQLCETGAAETVATFAGAAPASDLMAMQAEIDTLFAAPDLPEILMALRASDSDFARDALETIGRGAPLALLLALQTIRAARAGGGLKVALRNEYRVTSRAVREGEFIEGIRAALIDRDRLPRWRYPTSDAVPKALLDRMSLPAPGGDLVLSTDPIQQEIP